MTDVAFVTGAAGGIGQAICASLTRAGYTVYGGDLSVDAERCDGAVVLGPLDTRSTDSVAAAVAAAAKLGTITGVVNCAGIVRHTPLDDLHEADVDAVWDDARVAEAIDDLRFLLERGPRATPELHRYLALVAQLWVRASFVESYFPRENADAAPEDKTISQMLVDGDIGKPETAVQVTVIESSWV